MRFFDRQGRHRHRLDRGDGLVELADRQIHFGNQPGPRHLTGVSLTAKLHGHHDSGRPLGLHGSNVTRSHDPGRCNQAARANASATQRGKVDVLGIL